LPIQGRPGGISKEKTQGNGVSVQKIDGNASFFIQPRGRLVTTHH
jgi:hypothetical protein